MRVFNLRTTQSNIYNHEMWRFVALAMLGCTLQGADHYVCDQPQNGHVCNYPNSQLQKAFDEAKGNDTFYLQAGFTYRGAFVFRKPGTAAGPIIVTSSRHEWLPGAYSRVTPSDLPNMPVLLTNVQNDAALSGNLDSAQRPPSHWHFIGIAFSVSTKNEFDNAIVHTAGMGVNGWTIANEQQLPDGLVFDRVYVGGPLDDSLIIQNGIRINGKNSVFKNSFIQPIYCRGIECHGLVTQTHPGAMEVTNNFLSAASIPIFSGGTTPDYPGAVQKDLTMRFNYLFRPLKWWANPGNPQRAYFEADGAKGTCTKNLMEFKGLDRGMLEYNVHENIWQDNFCMGQYTAFTATPRQNYWESPPAGGSWGGSLGVGTLTTNGTEFSWTSNPKQMSAGHNVCGIVDDVHDCRKVVDVDNAAKKGHVSAAFTYSATNNPKWLWVVDDTPMVRDMTVQNSIFRNAAQGINMLARDKGTAEPGSDAGRIVRLKVLNNLFVNTISALANGPAIRIYTQEQAFTVDPGIGGRDITIEHNTFAWRNRGNNMLYFAAEQIKTISKIKNLSLRSNIFPPALVQPDGNVYALGASGQPHNDWGTASLFATGESYFTNNYLPYVSDKKCANANCRKNIASDKPVVFEKDSFKLASGSPLIKAGHDGTDIGVDSSKLPLIQALKLKVSGPNASLEFDLSGSIADAGAKQPCVLEVSADENLNSYLGVYRPIDGLNPAFFKQATASNRGAGKLPPVHIEHNHVSWPVSQEQTLQGDDGQSHPLGLKPAAKYWGRLMCYGDTRAFSFNLDKGLQDEPGDSAQGAKVPASQ